MAEQRKKESDTPVSKEEEQRPSEQGDGSPKPRNVAEEPSQQGLAGRSGSGGGTGGRGDAEAGQD